MTSLGELLKDDILFLLSPLRVAAEDSTSGRRELKNILRAAELDFSTQEMDEIRDALNPASGGFADTFDQFSSGAGAFDDLKALVDLLNTASNLFSVAQDLEQALSHLISSPAQGATRIVEYLAVRYLGARRQTLFDLFLGLGLIHPSQEVNEFLPTEEKFASLRRFIAADPSTEVRLAQFVDALKDPADFFESGALLGATDLRTRRALIERAVAQGAAGLAKQWLPALSLRHGVDLLPSDFGLPGGEIADAAFVISDQAGSGAGAFEAAFGIAILDEAIAVWNQNTGTLAQNYTTPSWEVSTNLEVASGPMAFGSNGLLTGNSFAKLSFAAEPISQEPFVLGPEKGTHVALEVPKAELRAVFEDQVELEFALALSAETVANASEADGFVQKLFSNGESAGKAHIGVSWSTVRGLHFRGGASLRLDIPVQGGDGTLLSIQKLKFSLGLPDTGTEIPVSLETDFSASIGPITGTVEGLGLNADLSFPTGPSGELSYDGNLGVMNATIGFNPPEGVGLDIDAGPTSGGGYLFFDTDAQEYGGAVELNFQTFGLAAVGLITTKMPDGSSGFSMMVIISAEFQGVQLGFGFVMTGVGGLLGINRQADVQALRSNMKSGGLSSIMFPEDVVENAQRIVSDVGKSFPVAEGNHVFGPILRIGWGTPAIFELTLGVVVSIPSPTKVLLLGRFELGLPALVDTGDVPSPIWIKVDFLGSIDPANGLLSLDGILYDSRLTLYSLEGQFAMQQSFGDDPLFLISIGGFHPDFEPPPKVPSLARLSISIGEMDNPRLRAELYLAITSNTVQMGAKLEAFAKISKFEVGGWASFDALIIFSPLSVDIDFKLRAHVKAGDKELVSIVVDLNLQGPNPWRVHGRAKVKVLFIKVKVQFRLKFGKSAPPPPPEIDVWEKVSTALGKAENWSATLPDAAPEPAVVFRELEDSQLLHPSSSISVRQKVMPLGLEIDQFSGGIPIDGDNGKRVKDVQLTGLSVGSSAPNSPDDAKEKFAPAAYLKLSNEEKLSRPSFESFNAGGRLGTTEGHILPADHVVGADPTAYEQSVIDTSTGFPFQLATTLGTVTSAFASAVDQIQNDSGERASTYQPGGFDISVDDPEYTVLSKKDGTRLSGVASNTNYSEATRELDTSGADSDEYHVAMAHEEKAA